MDEPCNTLGCPQRPTGDENCVNLRQRSARAKRNAAAVEPRRLRQHGTTLAATTRARSRDLQQAIDVQVEAAARGTMLAQCQALLSLHDADCLPHDPLFDQLAPRHTHHSGLPRTCDVTAALMAAAAVATAALAADTSSGGKLSAESEREQQASLTRLVWGNTPLQEPAAATCCHKRVAADATPQPALPTLCVATLHQGDDTAAAKRQRSLQLAANTAAGSTPAAAPPAVPGSGACSNSKMLQQLAQWGPARRAVARDLSFTPAVPPQPAGTRGTPATAASALRCAPGWTATPLQGAAGIGNPPSNRVTLKPFNLLRSPRTRAVIQDLNRAIRASAAAHIPYELRASGNPSATAAAVSLPPPAAAAGPLPGPLLQQQQQPRTFRAIRLC